MSGWGGKTPSPAQQLTGFLSQGWATGQSVQKLCSQLLRFSPTEKGQMCLVEVGE